MLLAVPVILIQGHPVIYPPIAVVTSSVLPSPAAAVHPRSRQILIQLVRNMSRALNLVKSIFKETGSSYLVVKPVQA